jgi:hypothetical protein
MSQDVTREDVVKAINIVAQDLGSPQSYSGRGMYGKHCLGIVTNDGELLLSINLALETVRYLLGVGDMDTPEIIDMVEDVLDCGISYDSMGHNTIVYFPGIEYIE